MRVIPKARWHTATAAAVLVALFHLPATGCRLHPETKLATTRQLLTSAGLVTHVLPRAYVGGGAFRMEVIEWLKGSGGSALVVSGFKDREGAHHSCSMDLELDQGLVLFVERRGDGHQTIERVTGEGLVIPVKRATPQVLDEIRRLAVETTPRPGMVLEPLR